MGGLKRAVDVLPKENYGCMSQRKRKKKRHPLTFATTDQS